MSGAPTRSFLPTGADESGSISSGLPYLRVGSGPPLVLLPGLTAHHHPPRGIERWLRVRQCGPLARHREVWWINRKRGLAPGATMADLARDHADALRLRFGHPVDVLGVSTGGSVALQLAADHPEVVRRLVVVSAAYRLGDAGRRTRRQAARWLRLGRTRRAAAAMTTVFGARARTRRVLRAVGWLLGETICGPGDPDLLAAMDAENTFDLRSRLGDITAPTLVAGGERDACHGCQLLEWTAAGIPAARLIIYPGTGHTGLRRAVVRDILAFLDGGA
ncbi:alpha/beta fold hydrolase [Amycolatopsis taiwanensis]|uniref:alpha/beta fold hydrolase n=1 Tax=Amycolatopsis taiwanensis TaxID=342230 RepID=UPI0004AE98B6|nr:alpha/beta hydrolase [Amycolatopsis taiwanensis]